MGNVRHGFLKTLFVVVGLLGDFSWLSAQTTPSFGDRTDVVVVEVPVQVIREGQPVRGLTAADFEISEGRNKLPITGFDVVDLAAATPALADSPIAPAARRHFLMLFDLSNAETKSVFAARKAAFEVVEKSLHTADLVAVATYSSASGTRLLLGFSSDRVQIARAIESVGVADAFDRAGDPLRLAIDLDEISAFVGAGAIGSRGTVRARGEAVLDELKEALDRSEINSRREQTQRLSAYTRSLADLAKLMANLDGRKYVVLLSEGFDSSLIAGTAEATKTREIDSAVERGELWKVDSDQRFGSTQSTNDLERMLDELRRADCVIEAVDIGGLRAGGNAVRPRADGTDGLFTMADQTGGELFRNWNDLAEAMRQMLARTSVTYVLSISPELLRDGSYHRLKVTLSDAASKVQRGARVVARPGYYAPKPFDQTDGVARMLDAAELLMSGKERSDFPAALLAAPFRGVGGKSFVPVVMEIDGKGLAAGTQGPTLPVEIYAYALTSDGRIADFFGQTLGLDLAKTREPLEQRGLKFFGHLELPLGDYSLRMLVRNGKTGAHALSVTPIGVSQAAVADPTDPEATLLPFVLRPFFPEPLAKWLVVRESPRGSLRDEPYPFLRVDQPYIPAARTSISEGAETEISIVGYDLPEGELKLQAKVSTFDGREVINGGDLTLKARESGGEEGREVIVAGFVPRGLAAGKYRLRVEVAGGEGASLVSLISADAPFEVSLAVQ